MDYASFHFPPYITLALVPVTFAAIAWFWLRHIGAAIFMAIAITFIAAWGYDSLLHYKIEQWLIAEPVYQILFRDFPTDKERFIAEHAEAFKTGGGEALQRKHEEMKIIMMVNHIPHYVDRTPTDVLYNHILAELELLDALNHKNKDLCQRYLEYSGYFGDVWRLVGSDIFLKSIQYNPDMIVEAMNRPQLYTLEGLNRSRQLYLQMENRMHGTGVSTHGNDKGVISCDAAYERFHILASMPPDDAALIVKFIYTKGHPSGMFLFNLW